jgi:hypothetical protein
MDTDIRAPSATAARLLCPDPRIDFLAEDALPAAFRHRLGDVDRSRSMGRSGGVRA